MKGKEGVRRKWERWEGRKRERTSLSEIDSRVEDDAGGLRKGVDFVT